MRTQDARRLRVGDRVLWDRDAGDAGTVTDVGYCGVTVAWDNGQTGTLHHNDCARLSRAAKEVAHG